MRRCPRCGTRAAVGYLHWQPGSTKTYCKGLLLNVRNILHGFRKFALSGDQKQYQCLCGETVSDCNADIARLKFRAHAGERALRPRRWEREDA